MLRHQGSDDHAAGVQWFFKDEIKSHGWYTAALRKAARACRKQILSEHDLKFLVKVADQLFHGPVLEERVFAVFLLENLTSRFSDEQFRLFERWLGRIASWADHDGLVHYLISPMVADQPERTVAVFAWARSKSRWARRAACVALIRGARKKQFFPEILQLTEILIADEDDMVQKGLGWLWRETAKYDPNRAVRSLLVLGKTMPRLVLRTACETLPAEVRAKILLKGKKANR
jgi:3-methyladenine DNA glycosylase AlkD